jgi:PAS domain S-box-containing protein
MAGTELDISSRKQIEHELRLAEAKSTGVVSISADAIISIDEAERITIFNEGAEKIFGYTRVEAIGSPLEMLIPTRFHTVHHEHVKRFASGEVAARKMGQVGIAIIGLRKNGDEFPADAAISKLELGGQRILTVALRDIGDQKRIEREQRFLADAGAALTASLDYEETLTAIAHLAVRDLADYCIVDLVGDRGEVRRLKMAARDPSRTWVCDLLEHVALDRSRPHLVHSALASRRPMLMEHLTPEAIAAFAQTEEHLRALEAASPRSMIAVPLVAHDTLLGAIALLSSTSSYGPSDLQLAEELARRAAQAIENAALPGCPPRNSGARRRAWHRRP